MGRIATPQEERNDPINSDIRRTQMSLNNTIRQINELNTKKRSILYSLSQGALNNNLTSSIPNADREVDVVDREVKRLWKIAMVYEKELKAMHRQLT